MTSDVIPEADPADALEQHTPATPPATAEAPHTDDPEVPEADALEQAQAIPYGEEDETPG